MFHVGVSFISFKIDKYIKYVSKAIHSYNLKEKIVNIKKVFH